MGSMTAWEYHDLLVASLRDRRDIEVLTFADAIRYNGVSYPFPRVASRDITPEDRVVLLRLSYHGGDEPLGATTFLHQAHRVIDEIHGHGLKFIAYPLPNPSSWEYGTRGGLSGNEGYDDWVWYELKNGKMVDQLGRDQRFTRWFWSSDPYLAKLGVKATLSQETALAHQCLRHDLAYSHVVAAIDVHQHSFVKEGDDVAKVTKPGVYFYAFGNRRKRAIYGPLVNRIDRIAPMLRHTWISAGQSTPMRTNDQGCIVARDGSFADLCDRIGVPWTTVLEVTNATPEHIAEEVVIQWIIGNVKIAQRLTA